LNSSLLTGEERHLSIRAFTDKQKREAYERQCGICSITGNYYPIEEMEADHIIPWSQGGKTNADNCQMVEKIANRRKSDK
jgi:5-methylcytosine-specific restriction endonuclease McrA